MRKFIVNVNGKQYEVEVEEITSGATSTIKQTSAVQVEPKAEKLAPQPKVEPAPKEEKKQVQVSQGAEVVTAPMPGTILSINVKEGDTVKEGQVLIILEAMKMENEILAPKDGKVVSIPVTKGSSVNTGDQLVIIE